jgi:mono/diheme cytochrome c family protein
MLRASRSIRVTMRTSPSRSDDDVMREFITNGTPRMPAFKHYLKPDQIEAMVR